MNEREEGIYERGSRAAWLSMLQLCLKNLGYKSEEGAKVAWISEREQAISMLRQVCEEHGDNEWPNDLHLADIIEKHLWRNLDSPDEPTGQS